MSWTAVSGATSYNLKRATVSGGPYTNLASGITGPSYTDTGLVNNATYYYVVSAVIATGESANSAEAAAIPGGRAVNCGGSAAGWFGADAYSSGGTASSTSDTIDMSGLINPAPQSVYKTSRYGSCTYTITGLTANTTYWLRLHFAESYWGAAGSRLFNVSINGTTVLGAFDIFAAAGGKWEFPDVEIKASVVPPAKAAKGARGRKAAAAAPQAEPEEQGDPIPF